MSFAEIKDTFSIERKTGKKVRRQHERVLWFKKQNRLIWWSFGSIAKGRIVEQMLPICFWSKFKVLVVTFKVLYNLAQGERLPSSSIPAHHLRTAEWAFLQEPPLSLEEQHPSRGTEKYSVSHGFLARTQNKPVSSGIWLLSGNLPFPPLTYCCMAWLSPWTLICPHWINEFFSPWILLVFWY